MPGRTQEAASDYFRHSFAWHCRSAPWRASSLELSNSTLPLFDLSWDRSGTRLWCPTAMTAERGACIAVLFLKRGLCRQLLSLSLLPISHCPLASSTFWASLILTFHELLPPSQSGLYSLVSLISLDEVIKDDVCRWTSLHARLRNNAVCLCKGMPTSRQHTCRALCFAGSDVTRVLQLHTHSCALLGEAQTPASQEGRDFAGQVPPVRSRQFSHEKEKYLCPEAVRQSIR